MTHSCTWRLHHIVFSTNNRRPFLPEDPLDRVWAYLGGIARKYGTQIIAIGGRPDHVHILASLPANLTLRARCNCSNPIRQNG